MTDPAPLPVLITLREATDVLRAEGYEARDSIPRSVWGRLLEHTLSARGLTEAGGEALLSQGGLLLMFDGLDEVGSW